MLIRVKQPTETLPTTPPLPGGAEDQKRRDESARRRRLITGTWLEDLMAAIRQYFTTLRAIHVGKPSQALNILLGLVQQLAVLYISTPKCRNSTEGASLDAIEDLLSRLEAVRLWPQMTGHMEFVLAMRESLIHASWTPDTTGDGVGRPLYRCVTPDLVYCEATAERPDMPALVVEARDREIDVQGRSGLAWTWDVWDLRDPARPEYKILLPRRDSGDPSQATDITEHVLEREDPDLPIPAGGFVGDTYPVRRIIDDLPILPYALYHALARGRLWDTWQAVEVVDGTLEIAAYRSFFGHLLRDTSWDQRYIIDGLIAGVSQRKPGDPDGGTADYSFVEMDPARVMMINSKKDKTASVGAMAPSGDVEKFGRAIQEQAADLGVHYHLSPDDYQRSGSVESGYAIALKRESVRAEQRRYEPQFRAGDEQLLSLTATLLNLNLGTTEYPEDGWTVAYQGLPRNPAETLARVQELRALMELDPPLMSPVDAYMDLHPELTREEAEQALEQLVKDRQRWGSMKAPQPPQLQPGSPPGKDDDEQPPEEADEDSADK